MNFKQALEALIAGKKIRRKCWEEGHYWVLDYRGILVNSVGKLPYINKFHLTDRDTWQVFAEPINESNIIELKERIKELEKIYKLRNDDAKNYAKVITELQAEIKKQRQEILDKVRPIILEWAQELDVRSKFPKDENLSGIDYLMVKIKRQLNQLNTQTEKK